MISVEIYRNQNKKVCGFSLKGHADYAEEGSDIVCSATSLLVFNTINSIEKFTNEDIEYGLEEKGGYLTCTLPNLSKGSECHDAELLLDTMVFGLESLEEEYGKYIHITNRRCR